MVLTVSHFYACAHAVSCVTRARERERERERETEKMKKKRMREIKNDKRFYCGFLYLPWLLLNVTVDRVAWLACSFRKGSRVMRKARSV